MAITYHAGRRTQGISTGGVPISGTIQDVSYANKSVAVNGGREPWVGNNGTKMYTIQDNPDNIYEYTLGTAWDVTTATYIGTSALSGTISPAGLIFKPDGTKFFVADFSTNKIHQYNLSTAWDVSTISTGTAIAGNNPYGMAFSSDGTQIFTCTTYGSGVANQYSLSTAWDLSSTVTSVSSLSVISGARAITFYDDGTRFFVLDGYAGTPYLAEYTCTAWTLSTAVATGNTFTFSETTSAVGAFVADNNTRLYLNNEGGTKKIWQYDIAQTITSDYTRLTNAQAGSRFEETDTRKMYHYNSTGYVTTDGSYTVLKFTEDGTFTPASAFNVEYLVVAGGGGGGSSYGGGGGAGGLKTNFGGTGLGVTAQTYNITVGSGGASGQVGAVGTGTVGGNSTFSSITSTGGGGGRTYWSAASNGGSGGGGSLTNSGGDTPGTGISGQGNNGASGSGFGGYAGNGGGGGGGAGSAGSGINGGAGLSSSITGTSLFYAGGGGAARVNLAGGAGGSGVGGTGGYNTNPTGGVVNTGSGGGGGNAVNDGGSDGVVILRFLTSGNTYTTSLSTNAWTEEGT